MHHFLHIYQLSIPQDNSPTNIITFVNSKFKWRKSINQRQDDGSLANIIVAWICL